MLDEILALFAASSSVKFSSMINLRNMSARLYFRLQLSLQYCLFDPRSCEAIIGSPQHLHMATLESRNISDRQIQKDVKFVSAFGERMPFSVSTLRPCIQHLRMESIKKKALLSE